MELDNRSCINCTGTLCSCRNHQFCCHSAATCPYRQMVLRTFRQSARRYWSGEFNKGAALKQKRYWLRFVPKACLLIQLMFACWNNDGATWGAPCVWQPWHCCWWRGEARRSCKQPWCNFIAATWVFPKIGIPQNGWFKMENPIRMDDLGGPPLFSETST